jgi:hypothetical protein
MAKPKLRELEFVFELRHVLLQRLRGRYLGKKHGRISQSAAQAIRQPRDRLRGQPQERQHSDGKAGTRGRLPPARGTL